MIKFKVFARQLSNGVTVPCPDELLYKTFEEAREVGRSFVLEKQEETGTGWTWHIEEITVE